MQCVHTQLPDRRKWEAPVWENTHFCSDCKMVVIKCYLGNAIKMHNCTFACVCGGGGVGGLNNRPRLSAFFLVCTCILLLENTVHILPQAWSTWKFILYWCVPRLWGWLFSLPHLSCLLSYYRAGGRTRGQQYSQAWLEVVSTAAPADVCAPLFHGPKYIPGHAVTTPEYIG